ncbi:MAG TPA: ice-binding family protein [Solirubrobacterales bacterium]|nr:ice-binding family protein [Solirubrobacterales bacterium]
MSKPTLLKRGFAGVLLAAALAFAALPAFAEAAPVDLATASPFVVLGGSTVTNTGPSVLNGDLGVSPGTSLPGFGSPAVVNGAVHNNDAVAAQAQSDVTTAYNVAAGTPVLPANDLSGTDLGGLVLAPGAYRYTSSAQLTGALTLDANGDPNAQFVFEIASTLTTASASSVVLVNGASPCNVYWQVGSSATLGSTTAFAGNLIALTDVSLNDGAAVLGRVFARNGQVSLIDNVLTRPLCETGSTPPGSTPPESTPPGSTPTETAPAGQAPNSENGSGAPASATSGSPPRVGPNRSGPNRHRIAGRHGRAIVRRSPREACTAGFRATVRGHRIQRVVFRLDGRRIGNRRSSPYAVYVKAAPGAHRIRVRVTFTDRTSAKTRTLPYRACARAVLHPRHGPSRFTG